ncbi:hypothetical protein C8Q76DRAFT_754544 [Earliella scabrosa]|nr:hypothetical protein C8Q76DRAFT_754544 [Earliella scabrosa]
MLPAALFDAPQQITALSNTSARAPDGRVSLLPDAARRSPTLYSPPDCAPTCHTALRSPPDTSPRSATPPDAPRRITALPDAL